MANIITGRKSGFIVRSGVRRRQMLWLQDTWGTNTLGAASTKVLISALAGGALALRPFTIVRSRTQLLFLSDQVAATEGQTGGYGETVVADQAVAAGVASVPSPSLNSEADWHVFQALVGFVEVVTGAGIFLEQNQYTVDSKAMRKVDMGEDLISVFDLAAGSSGATLTSFTRTLIKLH